MDQILNISVVCALVGAVCWLVLIKRKPRRKSIDRLSVKSDHDRIGHLYDLLREQRPDGLALTAGLRRLARRLDALCTTEGDVAESTRRVVRSHERFQRRDYPALLEVLRLAGTTRFREDLVRQIEPALAQAFNTVDCLVRAGLDRDSVREQRPNVRLIVARVEKQMLALLRAVEDYFTADLAQTVDHVLLVRREELDRAGIHLEIEQMPPSGALLCRLFPGDLRIVLENLLDVAMNAAIDQDSRFLHVRLESGDGMVTCRVHFSWHRADQAIGGIRFAGPDLGNEADTNRFATCRRLLHRFGGALWIETEDSYLGTSFILRMPRVEARLAREGQA